MVYITLLPVCNVYKLSAVLFIHNKNCTFININNLWFVKLLDGECGHDEYTSVVKQWYKYRCTVG